MSALLKRVGLPCMCSMGPLPLLAAVLYNVQFVATAPVAAMWLKYYVRTVEFDTDMGVVPSSMQAGPALHRHRERHEEGCLPC